MYIIEVKWKLIKELFPSYFLRRHSNDIVAYGTTDTIIFTLVLAKASSFNKIHLGTRIQVSSCVLVFSCVSREASDDDCRCNCL